MLLPLLATLAIISCRDKSKSGEAAAGAPRDTGPRLYVLGSSVHLRKAPSTEAESLEKLRIGTECAPLRPSQGGWRQVRCGDKEGYASASLLGPEKPSLEKLKAEARDPQRTLAQREDAALRAATLAPEDAALSKELGALFFERNFELLAGLKRPLKGPKLESPCDREDVAGCIRDSASVVRGVKRRAVTKEGMFVVAVGDSEQVAVYRGQIRYAKERQSLTAEVLERTRFASTPVMEQALFSGTWDVDAEAHASIPRLGQFVLDESAQGLLGRLPREWELLKRSEEGAPAVWINGCDQRPYLLRLSPDLHGRWLAVADKPGTPFPDERWVSAASKTERGTKLTLSRSAEDTAPQVFEIPRGGDAPASLGEALYSDQSDRYPDHREPCGSGEAGVGLAFNGEFLPEKAMVALYGSFDAANGSSQWAPSAAERRRPQRFNAFSATGWFLARPWKWGTYREGEQEKMLFLTQSAIYRPDPIVVGSGIFSKTEEGWRLERANRVVTTLPPYVDVEASDHYISVQRVGERGFVAVLSTDARHMGASWASLVLLSDMGGQESIDEVGTMEIGGDTSGVYQANEEEEDDPSRPACCAYDSTWKLVPDPEHTLPELVVTTKGTQLKDGTIKELESFHDISTFTFRSGQYTLSSHQDVAREKEGTAMTGETGSQDTEHRKD
ncbi:MAG TPA: hypothetical protein VEU33_45010 [Archangium sp.]|nr:hypothetical protein [Archangium sp.]